MTTKSPPGSISANFFCCSFMHTQFHGHQSKCMAAGCRHVSLVRYSSVVSSCCLPVPAVPVSLPPPALSAALCLGPLLRPSVRRAERVASNRAAPRYVISLLVGVVHFGRLCVAVRGPGEVAKCCWEGAMRRCGDLRCAPGLFVLRAHPRWRSPLSGNLLSFHKYA